MMKLNWGTGIAIFLGFFVLACIAFLFYTRTVDFTLVEDDYYPKGLKHEEVLVKMRNYDELQTPLLVQVRHDSVNITFPGFFKRKNITGNVHVYRPSDKKLDFSIPVSIDTSLVQTISMSRFKHGSYLLKIDWYCGGKGYYNEHELFVQAQ